MTHSEGHAKKQVRRQSVRSSFFRILGGSGAGQIVSFLAIPITARLYTPEAFGEFSVVLSFAAIASSLLLLGTFLAVISPKDEKVVAGLVGVGLIGSIIGCVLTYAIIWVALPNGYQSGRLFLAIAIPLQLLQNCLTSLFTQIAIRTGRYGSLGVRNAAQSISIIVGQIACGVTPLGEDFNGLIAGSILGGIVGNALLLRFALPYIKAFRIEMFMPVLRKYSRYTFVFAPATTFTTLSTQAPLFFVSIWFGAEQAGILGMVERLFVAPIALISFASSSIFDGELSRIAREGRHEAKRLYLTASGYLSAVSIAFGAFLLLLAPLVLPVFLGDQWSTAGPTLRIASLVATTRMFSTSIQGVYRVFGQARVMGLITVYRLFALAIVLVVIILNDFGYYLSVFLLYAALGSCDLVTWYKGYTISKEEDAKNLAP